VADHEPVRRAGEATVGHQRNVIAQTLTDQRRGDVEHLAHPGPAGRAFVTDHDDVTGDDRIRRDGGETLFLGVEHTRRTAMQTALVADELDDRAFGREVAAQHGEPTGFLQRPVDRDDDLLPRRLAHGGGNLGEGAAVDVQRGSVGETCVHQLAGDEGDAAGAVEIGRDEPSAGLQIGDDRCASRDFVEVVELERQAELACDRK